jgi:flagellar biosynthesis regulator FlaF
MATDRRSGSSQGCTIDLQASSGEGGLCLDNYLLKSTDKLNALTELVSRGDSVDYDSRAWMLAQVDFIIETIGNDSLELDNELRSNLLQLLLAVANLNEHMRHQAFLNR